MRKPLTAVDYRVASWVLQLSGGAAAKAGTGGVELWGPDARLVAKALCFGS